MSFEPINLFSHRIDPRGVAELLRSRGDATVVGPDDDWSEIILKLPGGSILEFGHSSEYYDGEDWPKQKMGMYGYFSRFPAVPSKAKVLELIGSFRFSLSVPQDDLDIESDDERLQIVYAVCQHLDGVIFTPSSLRDAQGRLLIHADGDFDPEAEFPKLPPQVDLDNEDEEADSDEEDDYEDPVPPTAERVARRALALTAVAARATLEMDAREMEEPDVHRQKMLTWIEELELGDELEPMEWKVLQRPVGTLDQRSFIDSMWRVEGLAVLAWALQIHDLPADDELIVPMEVYPKMGLFDVEVARSILADPQLRSPDELQAMHTHLLMLHWRLRDYSVRPQAMDFAEFSKDCWVGSFDIEAFRLIENDLAIGECAIDDAPENEVNRCQSLAMERHLAINWLHGYSVLYSNTDTST